MVRKYRSAIVIIGSILEELIKNKERGMNKSDIFREIGLKTPVGENYIKQLINASYIELTKEKWGQNREKHVVRILPKGIKRFAWIMQLKDELEEQE